MVVMFKKTLLEIHYQSVYGWKCTISEIWLRIVQLGWRGKAGVTWMEEGWLCVSTCGNRVINTWRFPMLISLVLYTFGNCRIRSLKIILMETPPQKEAEEEVMVVELHHLPKRSLTLLQKRARHQPVRAAEQGAGLVALRGERHFVLLRCAAGLGEVLCMHLVHLILPITLWDQHSYDNIHFAMEELRFIHLLDSRDGQQSLACLQSPRRWQEQHTPRSKCLCWLIGLVFTTVALWGKYSP